MPSNGAKKRCRRSSVYLRKKKNGGRSSSPKLRKVCRSSTDSSKASDSLCEIYALKKTAGVVIEITTIGGAVGDTIEVEAGAEIEKRGANVDIEQTELRMAEREMIGRKKVCEIVWAVGCKLLPSCLGLASFDTLTPKIFPHRKGIFLLVPLPKTSRSPDIR